MPRKQPIYEKTGALSPIDLQRVAKTFYELVEELEYRNHISEVRESYIKESGYDVTVDFWIEDSDTETELEEVFEHFVIEPRVITDATPPTNRRIILQVRKRDLEDFLMDADGFLDSVEVVE